MQIKEEMAFFNYSKHAWQVHCGYFPTGAGGPPGIGRLFHFGCD